MSAAFSPADRMHMARALALARRGLYGTDPNPRVGCVVVQGTRVVAEGWHEAAGGPHAEAAALGAAGGAAAGARVYVTLEPCAHHGRTPPCADALVAAGVGEVVFAARDPHPRVSGAGRRILEAAGIAVREGLLAEEARALNPGFFSRFERGRPWVRLKLAMSLDGRTALASGESRWITGPEARRDVHRWRARSSAVLTGIGTVLADDPRLTVRLPELAAGPVRPPARVVLDPGLRLPPTARLLADEAAARSQGPAAPVLVACVAPGAGAGAAGHAERAARLGRAGAEVLALPGTARGRVHLGVLLDALARREANEVLAECGPTLAGALLEGGHVDELLLYVAPCLLGDAARPLAVLGGIAAMSDRLELDVREVRRFGPDLRVRAAPRPRDPARPTC